MYLLILYLPLLSFVISILFGKWLGYKGSSVVTTASIFSCNLVSFLIFFEVCLNKACCYIRLCEWINVEFLSVPWGFVFDPLTATMLLVISSISLCAHVYSIDYMAGDPHLPRFLSYLSLFTFFMLILVTSDNLLQLFVGWEGVGLCSYLLINFWFTRIQANKAAIKAMLINKVSDLGLTLSICILFVYFKSVNFFSVFPSIHFALQTQINLFNTVFTLVDVISLLFLLGAMGKSAQIGLHIWLPDAMEGPTPVSSLIHAATMVTAGIFLIIRCSFLFEFSSTASFLVVLIGALTAFFSSTTGSFQNDIKKVIAYSTCSQIGYMIYACGYSGYSMAMFHLFNHAFFKALLFLTAGSIIHSFLNDQDIRKMGGLFKILPFSYICLVIGSFSLIGFPFLTGFYSKDVLLEASYNIFKENPFLVPQFLSFVHASYWLVIHSVLFTSLYSIRVLMMVFFNYYNGYRSYLSNIHDAPIFVLVPLIILSIFSIFVGFFCKDMMVGLGSDFWGTSIFTVNYLEYEFNSLLSKSTPLIVGFYVLALSVFFYNVSSLRLMLYFFKIHFYWVQLFFNRKWYFDKIYNSYIVNSCLRFAYSICFKLFDKGSLELLGPFGIAFQLRHYSKRISFLQTGQLYHYAGVVLNYLIGAFLIFLIFFLLYLFFFFMSLRNVILYFLFFLL